MAVVAVVVAIVVVDAAFALLMLASLYVIPVVHMTGHSLQLS